MELSLVFPNQLNTNTDSMRQNFETVSSATKRKGSFLKTQNWCFDRFGAKSYTKPSVLHWLNNVLIQKALTLSTIISIYPNLNQTHNSPGVNTSQKLRMN